MAALVPYAWLVDGDDQLGLEPMLEIPDTVVERALQSDAAEPLRELCARECDGGALACYRMGHGVMGGLGSLRALRTPVETLIPQPVYLASRRAQQDALIKIGIRVLYPQERAVWGGPVLDAQRHTACLTNLIAEKLK